MPISIGRSQRSALDDGFFDGLGSDRNEQVVPLSEVESTLVDFGEAFIARAQANLERADAVSSADLSDSIRLRTMVAGGVYTLEIPLADYYDYVNQGVRGVDRADKAPGSEYQFKNKGVSRAFMTALSKWIVREGLKSRIKKEARVTEGVYKRRAKVIREDVGIRSLAYAIGTRIKSSGIKRTNFFTDAFEAEYPPLLPKLAKAMGDDVRTVFRRLNVEINGNANT